MFNICRILNLGEKLQGPHSRHGWQPITRSLGTPFEAGFQGKIPEGREGDRNVPSHSDASHRSAPNWEQGKNTTKKRTIKKLRRKTRFPIADRICISNTSAPCTPTSASTLTSPSTRTGWQRPYLANMVSRHCRLSSWGGSLTSALEFTGRLWYVCRYLPKVQWQCMLVENGAI